MTNRSVYMRCAWISILLAAATTVVVGTSLHRFFPLPLDARVVRAETLIIRESSSDGAIILSALGGNARMQFVDSKGETSLTLVAEPPGIDLSYATGDPAIRLQVLPGSQGATLTLGSPGTSRAWGVRTGPDGKPVFLGASGAASKDGEPAGPPSTRQQGTNNDG